MRAHNRRCESSPGFQRYYFFCTCVEALGRVAPRRRTACPSQPGDTWPHCCRPTAQSVFIWILGGGRGREFLKTVFLRLLLVLLDWMCLMVTICDSDRYLYTFTIFKYFNKLRFNHEEKQKKNKNNLIISYGPRY